MPKRFWVSIDSDTSHDEVSLLGEDVASVERIKEIFEELSLRDFLDEWNFQDALHVWIKDMQTGMVIECNDGYSFHVTEEPTPPEPEDPGSPPLF